MKKIVIAIDGHSSCGKSTLAKDLALKLGFAYIDSGAMYRAVTLYFLRHKLDWKDADIVMQALRQIRISFKNIDQKNTTFLNDENVENEIRQMPVSDNVSEVAAISAVRKAMVQQQQAMGEAGQIVMDGRDIGTVVFPNADLKVFLTAAPKIRAYRRYLELKEKGQEVPLEVITENLLKRDHIDSTRADSPLLKAEDAVEVDNSFISQGEQMELVLKMARERM